jgi:Cft2 family RNA processing exonuclease
VVLGDDARRALKKVYALEDRAPVQRVLAHLEPLAFGQPRRLAQYRVRDAYLAYVMQERAELKRAHLLGV